MNKHFGKMGYPENIEQLLNQAFLFAFQHNIQTPVEEHIKNVQPFTSQDTIGYALSAFITKCFTDNLCKGYYPDMIRKVIKANKFYMENLQESLNQFRDEENS